MKRFDLKFIFILILFVAAGYVSWNLYFKEYVQDDTVDIHAFPKEIAGWVSEEMALTEREYAVLETRNVFARNYTSPAGETVMLFTVYSESNRKVSHPPEVCYIGAGLTVLEKVLYAIPVPDGNKDLMVNKLLLEQPGREQASIYWFKVGDTYTPSYWKQQVLIAAKSLVGQPASSAMVRVSSVIQDNDRARAEENIRTFTRLILPEIQKYLK